MNRITLILYSFFIFLSSNAYAFTPTPSQNLLEALKQEFISIASTDIQYFRLCELHSKGEDKKKFVSLVFPANVSAGMKDIQWKEMVLTEEAAKSGLHLGIVVIQYATVKDAEKAASKVNNQAQNYLTNSHILIRYITIKNEDRVAFVYSETFIDEKLKRLFNKLLLAG